MALSRVYDNANHQWLEISTGNSVSSVNGEVGHVVLDADDINYSSGVSIKDKIDSNNSRISNPNLLDNWYFKNPVNQRQFSSGSVDLGKYIIDRWMNGNASTGTGYTQSFSIANGNLSVTSNTGIWIGQRLENYTDLLNKTVTISAIIDGNLFTATGVLTTGNRISAIYNKNGCNIGIEVYVDASMGYVRFVTYVANNTPTISIDAVKLELGSSQTLAHQESGSWVLNEIPDYGEQLRRCQRYFQRIGNNFSEMLASPVRIYSGSTSLWFGINTKGTMRATPTVTCSNANQYRLLLLLDNGTISAMDISAIEGSSAGLDKDIVLIKVSYPTTSNQCMAMLQRADWATAAYIDLSAEL